MNNEQLSIINCYRGDGKLSPLFNLVEGWSSSPRYQRDSLCYKNRVSCNRHENNCYIFLINL